MPRLLRYFIGGFIKIYYNITIFFRDPKFVLRNIWMAPYHLDQLVHGNCATEKGGNIDNCNKTQQQQAGTHWQLLGGEKYRRKIDNSEKYIKMERKISTNGGQSRFKVRNCFGKGKPMILGREGGRSQRRKISLWVLDNEQHSSDEAMRVIGLEVFLSKRNLSVKRKPGLWFI